LKLGGYISIIWILEWVKLYYRFLKIKKVIFKVVSLYDIYNKIKILRYKFYKFLELLFILLKIWGIIIMDFIIKLPKLIDLIIRKKYNTIFIVINKLIK